MSSFERQLIQNGSDHIWIREKTGSPFFLCYRRMRASEIEIYSRVAKFTYLIGQNFYLLRAVTYDLGNNSFNIIVAGIDITEYAWIYKTSFYCWNKWGNLKIKSGEEFLEGVSEDVISNSADRS